ncbi:glycosyltransferase [Gramella sp. MT6]|uniref:glycosyltransferase n=1 Tax=Gramella sp. MT6 TaxID=2705471 RepID=UPI001C5FD302|nr:glycosyltransferase [Gramella sp. MT6]QYA24390.1 glycosyltransferase [Gramella sp. MT6]
MQDRNKPTILILVGYYIPGFKAGGPLRTILHLVEHLSEDYNFKIICRDRDLGDINSYNGVKTDKWVKRGQSEIFYLSPQNLTFKYINNIIKKTSHDILYLNSFFDPVFTIKPLLGRKFKLFPNKKLILAPRGEFSPEALKLRTAKKRAWIFIANILGVYKNITFQASSVFEESDIRRISSFGKSEIKIALDLPSKITPKLSSSKKKGFYLDETLKLIFLSRISPMKNLDYALKILSNVKRKLVLDIYGPIEDSEYWDECRKIISRHPANIVVSYKGSINPQVVPRTFLKYDLFILPSRGENYGHVIAESLSAGTPVLISNKTPWKNLEFEGLGWDCDLEKPHDFVTIINQFEPEANGFKRVQIQKRLIKRLENSGEIEANKNLFSFK